jgi:hypothetical protein
VSSSRGGKGDTSGAHRGGERRVMTTPIFGRRRRLRRRGPNNRPSGRGMALVAREKEKGGWEKWAAMGAARFKGGMMGETKEEGAGGEDGTRWPVGWGPTTGGDRRLATARSQRVHAAQAGVRHGHAVA